MEDEERKVQSKLKRGFTTPAKSYKDWWFLLLPRSFVSYVAWI
jgi:hypothetical protein